MKMNMLNLRTISRYLILSAVMLTFFYTAPAFAVKWEMAGPLPESNFLTQNLKSFVNDVDRFSEGKLKLNLHVSGSLIKPQETKQALRNGLIPIGQMYLYAYGNEDPTYETSALPFIAGSYDKAWKMWEITKPYMDKLMYKQRIKLLYVVPWPIQGFYTKKHIRSMDDLKNVKFRVYSTKTARMAELLGANPVQIQFGEIAQAFATGLVGAMYTSPQTGINTQAWDFAKYFTNTFGGNLVLTAVGVNIKSYRALPQASQQALQQAAIDAQTKGWLTSQAISDNQIEILKKNGMIVESPSPEFRKSLDRIGQQILEEWAAGAGDLGKEVLKNFKQ